MGGCERENVGLSWCRLGAALSKGSSLGVAASVPAAPMTNPSGRLHNVVTAGPAATVTCRAYLSAWSELNINIACAAPPLSFCQPTTTTKKKMSTSTSPPNTSSIPVGPQNRAQDGKLPHSPTPFHLARRASDLGTLARGGADVRPPTASHPHHDAAPAPPTLPAPQQLQSQSPEIKQGFAMGAAAPASPASDASAAAARSPHHSPGASRSGSTTNLTAHLNALRSVVPQPAAASTSYTSSSSLATAGAAAAPAAAAAALSPAPPAPSSVAAATAAAAESAIEDDGEPGVQPPPGYRALQHRLSHDYACFRRGSSASLEELIKSELESIVHKAPKQENTAPQEAHPAATATATTTTDSKTSASDAVQQPISRRCSWIPPETDARGEVEEARKNWFSYENFKELMYNKVHPGTNSSAPSTSPTPVPQSTTTSDRK